MELNVIKQPFLSYEKLNEITGRFTPFHIYDEIGIRNNAYNGKLGSAELLLLTTGEVELIRRAETPDNYFATLDVSDFFMKQRKAQKI